MRAKGQWHEMTAAEAVEKLQSDGEKGLSVREAAIRLGEGGMNRLAAKPKRNRLLVFLDQFKDFMVLVLLAAAIVSGFVGELADTVTILAIVLLNGFLGYVQTNKAEESLEKLKNLSARHAQVLRGGMITEINSEELVKGDIVLLETGVIVPADLRLLETHRAAIDEGVLTGESLPVEKNAKTLFGAAASLGDRANMAYMGTTMVQGKARGIVVGTGMGTEMGLIAVSIQEAGQEPTPLEKRLDQMGRRLVFICGVIVAVVVLLGWLRGESFQLMFLTGISLAVAAVPEGLPAIVTVALAIGIQRMAKRNAIVRHLPAVETLGCATVICSDKTGTLTQSAMMVTEYYCADAVVKFSGKGYEPKGEIEYPDDGSWLEENREGLKLALTGAALCSNARLARDQLAVDGLFRGGREKEWSRWQVMGDPTEGAMLVASAKAGIWRENLREKKLDELPFDSDRKRMSVLTEREDGSRRMYCKGAPDVLLARCSHIWWRGEARPMTEALAREILKANEAMAGRALRVLAVAYKNFDGDTNDNKAAAGSGAEAGKGLTIRKTQEKPKNSGWDKLSKTPVLSLPGKVKVLLGGKSSGNAEEKSRPEESAFTAEAVKEERWLDEGSENGLVFLALAGMMDPPREGVKEAVAKCHQAGIRTLMLTGDHILTAEAIARKIGIMKKGQQAVTGSELDELTDEELKVKLQEATVFARVSPRHKMRLVQLLKERGEICAMTGDGVNDGPAVKAADIGIAMGQTGTDVTREAADLVLADDNFTTIAAAVEEGRIIYNNIRRFIRYLLASNTGEVLVMLLTTLFGVPLPLLPIQILWVNLVTDGLPAMALGLDPGDEQTMLRKPRHPKDGVFAGGLGSRIVIDGIIIALATLTAYFISMLYFRDIAVARTVAFCALVFAQLVYVFRCAASRGIFRKCARNPWLPAAVLCSLLMQLAVVYLPFLQKYFNTSSLNATAWMMVLLPIGVATILQQIFQALSAAVRKEK